MIPETLKQPYEALTQAYNNYKRAEQDYLTSKLPKYVSIPAYFEQLGLKPSYSEQKELAFKAEAMSSFQMKSVKVATTEIGHLYCYLEGILDACFDQMFPEVPSKH